MGRMTIEFGTLDELAGFLVRHGVLPGDDPTWRDKRFPGTPELEREPLTRKTLLLALQLHSLFLSECDDESLQGWTDFMCHHGAELISLGGLYLDLEWGYVFAFVFFIVMMFVRPEGLLARRS